MNGPEDVLGGDRLELSSATAVWGISDETGTSRPGRRSDRRGTLEACFAVSAIRGGEMDDAVDAGYQRELRGYWG